MRIASFISISLLTSGICHLSAAQPPSPATLCAQMQQGLKKVKPACIALKTGQVTASAVVISADGLVLTAAHVASRQDPQKKAHILFENNTQAKAEVLGWNLESDIGLYRITTPSKTPWPHAELAQSSKLTGAFCFTYAHPSGHLNGRPAQLRLGRIFSHSIKRGKPALLLADCNIQPGDSGGGLFSLDGKLIGINSSAAGDLGLNIFPAIDQYHLDRQRLVNQERWGDANKGHANPKNLTPRLDQAKLQKIQAEFSRRIKDQHPQVIDFILKHRTPNGKISVTPQDIVQAIRVPSVALGMGLPLCYGLDDPALVKQLPPLPSHHTRPIPIVSGGKHIAIGLAADQQHILTKASLLEPDQPTHIMLQKKKHLVQLLATHKDWDIALLKTNHPLPLPTIKWQPQPSPVIAGDLLIAPDTKGRPLWGNATDSARTVSKARSTGTINQTLISKHRAPYPIAIRHSVPLMAKDAGTPVFDKNGQFAGMHIARFSRTMGLLIPAQNLYELTQKMLNKQPATTP